MNTQIQRRLDAWSTLAAAGRPTPGACPFCEGEEASASCEAFRPATHCTLEGARCQSPTMPSAMLLVESKKCSHVCLSLEQQCGFEAQVLLSSTSRTLVSVTVRTLAMRRGFLS